MKILKKTEILRLRQTDHVKSEFSILKMLEHPFLINMSGYYQDERYFYMLLELVNGGELFTYMRNEGTLPPEKAEFYASQVVLMFIYLHNKDIIYRSLYLGI